MVKIWYSEPRYNPLSNWENIDLIDVEFEMRMQAQDFSFISYDAQSGSKIEQDSSSLKSNLRKNFQSIAVIASRKVLRKSPKMHFNHTGISQSSLVKN
jgi:hypothetical protein